MKICSMGYFPLKFREAYHKKVESNLLIILGLLFNPYVLNQSTYQKGIGWISHKTKLDGIMDSDYSLIFIIH